MEASIIPAAVSLRATERRLRTEERQLCTRALADTQSITGAADLLGINRRTFLRRVMQYKITLAQAAALQPCS